MKCFYHSADLDGHCSGAIVKKKFPQCEMIGINYGDDFPWSEIQPNEIVYMVDFGLQPFDDMIKLNNMCCFTWIDHHKTAIDEACKRGFLANSGQLLQIGKAGCELTWEFLYPAVIPEAVYFLGRYDVWDHSNPKVLPFQYGFRQIKDTLPDNQKIWKSFLKNDTDAEINHVLEKGTIILEYEDSQNEKFCKAYSFETELNGLKAICANIGPTNSKIFDSVVTDRHDLMIIFCRMKFPARMWKVSLYSNKNNIDCGKIAKSFGGGGHRGAAGFQCEELPFVI